MKTYAKLFILSATLVCMTTIVGCNKPQEATDTTKPSTSVNTEISDSDVTMKVKTALHSDQLVKSFDITAVTTKGDVRLTGIVDNQDQLEHIDKLVRSIEGVHSMHDELTIKK
ncbi:MAG: BON domain-containing protein [Methylophilus sp.]|nr:BON domain-containing protein [Methylophilus sp.]